MSNRIILSLFIVCLSQNVFSQNALLDCNDIKNDEVRIEVCKKSVATNCNDAALLNRKVIDANVFEKQEDATYLITFKVEDDVFNLNYASTVYVSTGPKTCALSVIVGAGSN